MTNKITTPAQLTELMKELEKFWESIFSHKLTKKTELLIKFDSSIQGLQYAAQEIQRLRNALDKCEQRAISGMAACVEGQRPFVQCSDISDIAAQALQHSGEK